MHFFEITYVLWAFVIWFIIRWRYKKEVQIPIRQWLTSNTGPTDDWYTNMDKVRSFVEINRSEYYFIITSAVAILGSLVLLILGIYIHGLSWIAVATYVAFVIMTVEITLSSNINSPQVQCDLRNAYKALEADKESNLKDNE